MRHRNFSAWLPVLTLPSAIVFFTPADCPRWVIMWLLAFAIFVGCKWLTWRTTPAKGASARRQLGYLLAWPGLDAPTFLHAPNRQTPTWSAWCLALAKFGLGLAI